MRYLSREMQRQIARLLKDADADQPLLARVADEIEKNNGTPATAFQGFLAEGQSK